MDKLDENFFIAPGTNLQGNDSELTTVIHLSIAQLRARWNTPKGRSILTRWETNRFKRDVLNESVGKYYDHTDLRGIDLSNKLLRNVNLSDIDFFGANLSNTTIERSSLTNSWLSCTDISGTTFEWTKMDGVILDDVTFNNRTKFLGINLTSIDFTLASLLQDLAVGQQKIEHLERRSPFFATFLKWTCDYGRSFRKFLICCIGAILMFSLLYYLVPNTINSSEFSSCLYFSALTFMKIGHADIHPTSDIGRIITIAEVSIGYIMLGLLVAIFSRRMIVS